MKHHVVCHVIALIALLISGVSLAQASIGTTSGTTLTTPLKHQEEIQVGPYRVIVGFNEWPMQAERSLHVTFSPVGGIVGLKGSGKFIPAGGLTENQKDQYPYEFAMTRFTRDQTVWGNDDMSLPTQGPWTLEISLEGPKGKGTGRLEKLEVGERPAGPSANLIYALSMIPILAILILCVRSWIRVRPAIRRETHAW
jgi:hypothetical protein